MNAIEQLKSVLCGPEGKCCITGSDEDRAIVDRALHALAQPQQEPVYLVEDDFGLFRITDKADYMYWSRTGRHKTFIANTTPPKREPLTVEEVNAINCLELERVCYEVFEINEQSVIDFVRALEAKHGIKENT